VCNQCAYASTFPAAVSGVLTAVTQLPDAVSYADPAHVRQLLTHAEDLQLQGSNLTRKPNWDRGVIEGPCGTGGQKA